MQKNNLITKLEIIQKTAAFFNLKKISIKIFNGTQENNINTTYFTRERIICFTSGTILCDMIQSTCLCETLPH